MLEIFGQLGSIQVDPIAVAGRSHDLVLHARVAGYEPAWCDVLYERREIFEVTNKALSLVPTGEFPWFRLGFGRKGPRFHAAVLAENAVVAERVLGRIRAGGFVDAMRDALGAYLRFAGAGRLEWAPHLATEKRLFLARP